MIGKALEPIGTVHDGCDLRAVLDPTLVRFDQRQPCERLSRRQARKIGMVLRVHFAFGCHLDFTNRQDPHRAGAGCRPRVRAGAVR